MPDRIQMLIEIALQEDIGASDITSDALFEGEGLEKSGVLLAKQDLVVAGLDIARRTFLTLDHHLEWKSSIEDGETVSKGVSLAQINGRYKSLLRAERTALNFLQHLSGIATLTRKFVDKVKDYPVQILDTRKTLPGFRALEKNAVRAGGGKNHRFGLFDRYLIKDNHLMGSSISDAIARAKKHNTNHATIEVEVQSLDQIEEALKAGPDIVLLDNFTPEELKKAVQQIAHRVKTEASGGINLENVVEYAKTGVDFISIGALTHSAPAADISLEITN